MSRRKQIMLLLEWYDYRIHRGVAQVASEQGWQLNCYKGPVPSQSILRKWKIDGCIALLWEGTETLKHFQTHDIPLIEMGLNDHQLLATRIVTDNDEIARLAAEHFRDHGYKEVFTLNPDGNKMYQERLQAFQENMEADGGKVTVLQSAGRTESKFIDELTLIAANRGHTLEELSIGFFAYQDTEAAEMISICLQNNLRVPENIAILGVDNDDLVNNGLTIGLSSVDSDQEGLGRGAANALIDLLDNPDTCNSAKIIRHKPKGIVARQSTDCYAVQNPLVSKALHWIKNNYYTPIQASDIATAMGVTQQGLQKAFATNYSKSPAQEIRHQRTLAVSHLLTSSNAKLEEIAKNCGYGTVNSLINSFRSNFGMTPGKYREAHKAKTGDNEPTTPHTT